MSTQETARPRFDFVLRYSTIIASMLAIGVTEPLSKDPGAQHLLPEPFDFFSHSSNLSISAVAAGMTAAGVAIGPAESRGWSLRRTRTVAAVSAMALTTALNAISETKLGVTLLPFHSTPDPIDFAYGMAGGAIGAGLVTVKETSPGENE